ncbi:CYCA2-3 [Symbiodinium necroappetens]|uniref:CYCA2-3 protein n=1 Tax=Symbiodinium necroappetens TaxID=1628268 RepID=A0A812VQ31_9DINO|nr:CYCA2-3 [Symbiodinium necroappetens]|eukprot:CAMPEP_0181475392 /NCGR_PEP_ID=MMETSP1110-20121109/41161_1 /TAXON_ID=174948 /ORGANISM="Symbiodinium sp., Strain CCMP421" /LENGTH=494 /DNA_ID=CAMNT_0023600629 /DNA_START=78 /DNA_END=1562 /DNA_ORIENTATION=+
MECVMPLSDITNIQSCADEWKAKGQPAHKSKQNRGPQNGSVAPRRPRASAERKQQAHQAPVRQALLPKDMDVPSTKPGLGGRFLGGASSPLGMEVEESESDRMVLNAAQDLWQVWVSQCTEHASAPRGLSPWMQFVLWKFGRSGPPGLVNALMRPPPGIPKPPSTEVPIRPYMNFICEELQEGSFATLIDNEFLELYGPAGTRVKVKELGEDGLVHVAIVDSDRSAWIPKEYLKAEPTSHSQLQELLAGGLLLDGCHRHTERARPYSEDIHACIGSGDRQQSVLWLAQVCSIHQLDDSVLFVCVMLLDRYCATSEDHMELGRAHRTVLAIFSIALKVLGVAAGGGNQHEHLRFIAEGLGENKFSKQDIIRAELEVLQALGFDVAAHSPLDFLESFLFSVERPRLSGTSALACMATFLLQLSLGDANLLHRYPYAALAAGAVYVGLWCTQASSERCQLLLQDAREALSPKPQPAAMDMVPEDEIFTDFDFAICEV